MGARAAAAVHVDLSQLETLLSVTGEQLLVRRSAGAAPPRPATGRPTMRRRASTVRRRRPVVALTVHGDDEWQRLVALVGDPSLDALPAPTSPAAAGARRHRHRHRPLDPGPRSVRGRRGPAGRPHRRGPRVLNGDLVDDPHLASRGFIVEWDQPDVGPRRFPGFPIHFERRRYDVVGAPGLGADNGDVLASLGFSRDEVARPAG